MKNRIIPSRPVNAAALLLRLLAKVAVEQIRSRLGSATKSQTSPEEGSSMRFETWQKRYQPVLNHVSRNTAIEGHVFLPSGADLDYVRSQSRDKVWSFIVCDEGKKPVWLISEGYHFVNLMGYLVTQNAFDTVKTYAIRY